MPNPLGIKTSPVAQRFSPSPRWGEGRGEVSHFKIRQPDGKQLAALFLFLHFAGFADFHCHLLVLCFVLRSFMISSLWAKEAQNKKVTSLQRIKRKWRMIP